MKAHSTRPTPPMHIRPFRADEGMLIKCVRLRSLADAPYAFGVGSFDEESAYPDAYWHALASQVGGRDPTWGDRCASFVLLDADEPSGTVTCYLCPRVERRAYVTAAWIDPRLRRGGLGRRLIDASIAWARARGADHIRLWVDDTNPDAAAFYEAIGFAPTGECRPVRDGAAEKQSAFELRLALG